MAECMGGCGKSIDGMCRECVEGARIVNANALGLLRSRIMNLEGQIVDQRMKAEQIRRLVGKTEQRGYTIVPLNLHWKGGRVKADIALAKGKAEHDKRNTIKDRDWEREKGRLMRHKVSSPGKD